MNSHCDPKPSWRATPAHEVEGFPSCSVTSERFPPLDAAGLAGSASERNLRWTGRELEVQGPGDRGKSPSERLYRKRRKSTREAAARGRIRRGCGEHEAVISSEVTY
jgi:hypothetical protein